jgi:hypothetical protein
MVPKAVQDAGYTAVGLGVLALQQVQTRRRHIARTVTNLLQGLPRLPGPVGQVLDGGRALLCEALRPSGGAGAR